MAYPYVNMPILNANAIILRIPQAKVMRHDHQPSKQQQRLGGITNDSDFGKSGPNSWTSSGSDGVHRAF